jgi:hypothetical protein
MFPVEHQIFLFAQQVFLCVIFLSKMKHFARDLSFLEHVKQYIFVSIYDVSCRIASSRINPTQTSDDAMVLVLPLRLKTTDMRQISFGSSTCRPNLYKVDRRQEFTNDMGQIKQGPRNLNGTNCPCSWSLS